MLPSHYVLYMHAKGVWGPHKSGRDKHPKANVDWRQYLTYFMVERWQDCMQIFDENPGVQAVGCQLKNKRPKRQKLAELRAEGVTEEQLSNLWHFSGNFWWARISAIKGLPEPYSEEQREILTWRGWKPRLQAERWIGTLGRNHLYEIHNSGVDHCTMRYPRKRYALLD